MNTIAEWMYYITSANNQLLFFLPRMHNVHTGGMGGMILIQLFRDKRETYLTKYGGKYIGTAVVPAVPLPPSLLLFLKLWRFEYMEKRRKQILGNLS